MKNLPANAGDTGDVGSIPGLGTYPGGGNGTPLWYSCLESPMDRGAWWATDHELAELDITEHAKNSENKKCICCTNIKRILTKANT